MTHQLELPYALIALDVDGTLLTDDHELTEGTREAVRAAGLHGAELMLCTGRGPAGALLIMDQLGLGGTIITHNGAATVDAEDRSIVHQFDFTQEQVEPFVTYCQEHKVHYDLNTAFDLYVFQQLEQEGLDMYAKYGVVPIVLKPGDRVPGDLVKLTVFAEPKTLDALEAEWRTWQTDLQVIRSGEYFVDVQHASANKGSALEQFALKRGIDQQRIMAIGNYYNDIGMLRYAGLGVAMANSPDEVKAAANAQTRSNAEDGVKFALERYVLGVEQHNQ
ncbi:Cof-like hydrolase [Paenibacillus curdlanolyticus YK9]|uniref:Cof-like hydrolase n=1 Tax=Paenibacillus curdlanolyticus YK9 TaxID=717606 RepID=E0I316_9BACL|nr:Cof-type HAD-IIB family hydrolase [Paenibacillus curdlanolyticus]EFM12680.1 Cof-like hydrolase [Paenibacillus curdlanolyticus YK9]